MKAMSINTILALYELLIILFYCHRFITPTYFVLSFVVAWARKHASHLKLEGPPTSFDSTLGQILGECT